MADTTSNAAQTIVGGRAGTPEQMGQTVEGARQTAGTGRQTHTSLADLGLAGAPGPLLPCSRKGLQGVTAWETRLIHGQQCGSGCHPTSCTCSLSTPPHPRFLCWLVQVGKLTVLHSGRGTRLHQLPLVSTPECLIWSFF